MSDAPSPAKIEALEKMWKQTRYEPWKVMMAACGVLGGGFVALLRFH